MNALPAELLAQIMSDCHAGYVKMAHLSSVSKAWKEPVERFTFRSLTVATDELDDFAALFSGDNILRWSHVGEIRVIFVLRPLPNPGGCCATVRRPDRQADSHEFTASVVNLFAALNELSGRQAIMRPFPLYLNKIHRRMKKGASLENPAGGTCREPQGIARGKHSGRETREAQAISDQFRLLQGSPVPYVRGITALECTAGCDFESLKSD